MKRVHVREAEGIFKIEVPDSVRKIVIVKAEVYEVITYITVLHHAVVHSVPRTFQQTSRV
jgi:hypothetical protein